MSVALFGFASIPCIANIAIKSRNVIVFKSVSIFLLPHLLFSSFFLSGGFHPNFAHVDCTSVDADGMYLNAGSKILFGLYAMPIGGTAFSFSCFIAVAPCLTVVRFVQH